jgi:hypothetical protein
MTFAPKRPLLETAPLREKPAGLRAGPACRWPTGLVARVVELEAAMARRRRHCLAAAVIALAAGISTAWAVGSALPLCLAFAACTGAALDLTRATRRWAEAYRALVVHEVEHGVRTTLDRIATQPLLLHPPGRSPGTAFGVAETVRDARA